MNSTLTEAARTEHFQRKLDQHSIGALSTEIRRIDGVTVIRRDELLTARARILATASHAPGHRVVGGMAASIVHGTRWFDPGFQIPLFRAPTGSGIHCEGRIAHRFELQPEDICAIDGVLVTTPVRTAFDIGRMTPDWRGLGNLDALHRATGFSRDELVKSIENHKGWRHIRQLRALAPLIDGRAESPPESWVRLLIIRGDLPTPDLQIPVIDDTGAIVARADLGYAELKIDIEYDGEEFHSSPTQRESVGGHEKLLGDGHEAARWRT